MDTNWQPGVMPFANRCERRRLAVRERIFGVGKVIRGWLFIPLIFVAGCAGVTKEVETLRAQGYQPVPMPGITRQVWDIAPPQGPLHWLEEIDLWLKESREIGRTVHFCLVPKVPVTGYWWKVTVSIDDRETWFHHGVKTVGLDVPREEQMDCIAAFDLPAGRLNFNVNFIPFIPK